MAIRREKLDRHYRDLDDDDPRPMNGFSNPPVTTAMWTQEDWKRWEELNRAACKAFDEWNDRHPWIHVMDKEATREPKKVSRSKAK